MIPNIRRKKERKKENGGNSGRGQVVFTYSQVSPTPIHVHVGVSRLECDTTIKGGLTANQ